MSALSPDTLDAMLVAGLTREQIVAIAKAALIEEAAKKEEVLASKREANRDRQQRFRDKRKEARNEDNALRSVTSVTKNPSPSPERTSEPLSEPTRIIKPPSSSLKVSPSAWPLSAWQEFWNAYPRKQGKAAARKAFDRIDKAKIVPFARLMAGLAAYLATNPDPQFIPHPATWLNGERWNDEHIPAKPSWADLARDFHASATNGASNGSTDHIDGDIFGTRAARSDDSGVRSEPVPLLERPRGDAGEPSAEVHFLRPRAFG